MKTLRTAVAVLILVMMSSVTVKAQTPNSYEEPKKMRCRCYTGENLPGRNIAGLTIAGKPEWVGKTCIVYEEDEDGSLGNPIGIYEFTVASDEDNIKIYRASNNDCATWKAMYGNTVYVQMVDAKG